MVTNTITLVNGKSDQYDKSAPMQINKKINCNYIQGVQNSENFEKDIAKREKKLGRELSERERAKIAMGYLANWYNKEEYWENVNLTPEQLGELIGKGITARAGIKTGGNQKADIKDEIHWMFFDFDKGEKPEEIAEKLAEPTLWHYTMSHSEEQEKFRLIYRLSRPVNVDEYQTIYQNIMWKVFKEADQSTFDAGRLFYGTIKRKWVFVAEKLNVLDVEEWLIEEPPLMETRVMESESEEGQEITERVCQYLYEEVFVPKYNEDGGEFYSIGFWDDWEFKKRKVTTEEKAEGMVAKWQGSNPFSHTNSSRSSLVVSYFKGKLPVFYDRSGNLKEKKVNQNGQVLKFRNGSTFIAFFYEINKRFNSSKCRYGSLKTSFNQVIKDICKVFGIPDFDFKQVAKEVEEEKLESIKNFVKKSLKNRFFHITAEKGKSLSMFYFLETGHYWHETQCLDNVYREGVQPLLREKYGEDEIEGNNKVQTKVLRLLRLDPINEPRTKYPDSNRNYFTFKNGVYDIISKQFTPWEQWDLSEIPLYNRHNYEQDFQHISDDHPLVQDFHTYLNAWTNNNELYRDLLYSWFLINMMGKGWMTECLLLLFGKAGKGKSTYGLIIQKGMTDQFSHKADTKLLMSDYSHATASLEDCRHLFLEEYKGNTKTTTAELIKHLAGNDGNNTLRINPKGKESRVIAFYAGITANCQDLPNLSNDDGQFRRTISIEVDNFTLFENEDFVKRLEQNASILFMWALTQDFEPHVKKVKQLSKHPIFKKHAAKIRINNDPVALWIQDCVDITNNLEDRILTNDLYENYADYAENALREKAFGTRYWGKKIRQVLTSETIGFNWKPSNSDYKFKGQRCFRGLKFKTTSTEDSLTAAF